MEVNKFKFQEVVNTSSPSLLCKNVKLKKHEL